jgi:hypothetical protein
MAMLTKRPRRTHRLQVLLLIAFLAASLLFGILSPLVRAVPTETDNGNASRTVSWKATDPGLVLQGVSIENGNATLPWTGANLSWRTPGEFVRNGSADPNLAVGPTAITLRADDTNYVRDPDFASAAPWTYEPSSFRNVTAVWDNVTRTALFRHSSSKTVIPWDGMDTNPGTWIGLNGVAWISTAGAHQPPGMLGLNFSLGPGPLAWAGVQRSQPVNNWSTNDRFVLWILASNASLPLTFNVTAYVGSTFHTTQAQRLAAGWQEVAVDLTQLGPARSSLVSLQLRVYGQNLPAGRVYFDDARVGNTKRFDETAWIRQTVVKANVTSSDTGNAMFRLNWSLPTASGVGRVIGIVNVTGPSGTSVRTFAAFPTPGWHAFVADVSGTSSLWGLYQINLGIRVVADNTSASSVEAHLTGVSILFPNRHNGTYLSAAVPLGAASDFLRVNWSFASSGPTTVRASVRSGNDSSLGSASWSAWRSWTSPGPQPVGLAAAGFVQIQVDLSTTNASVTPSLRGMVLESRHRSLVAGTITGVFPLAADMVPKLITWRTLRATDHNQPGSSISYAIGDGTSLRPVIPGTVLTNITWPSVHWSATLATTGGLATPRLERVDLIYEYLGVVVRVDIQCPGCASLGGIGQGGTIRFSARALDVGSHVVSPAPADFVWTTDDKQGQVRDGQYTAGEVGDHNVTATYRGTTLSQSIRVHVVASWFDSMMNNPYGVPVLASSALVVLAYVAYQYGIRRMFKVDDLFLIGKDGRLLMHNTRRMRADRDEDILSGMLTAILSFLRDSDPEENGELKRFEIGGKTTLLERGAHAYLVAVYSGKVPRWAGKDLKRFMTNLETNFGTSFASWSGDPADLQGLKEFTGHFVSRFRYRPPRRVHGRAA